MTDRTGRDSDDPSSVYSATEDASSAYAPSSQHARPTSFGDFEIIREIGRGGMGVVYEAWQVSLSRRVALKVLSRGAADSKPRRRFEREAKAAARLHHTNIVPVFGVGEHDGTPYYVMQLITGTGLHTVLNVLRSLKSPIDATEAAATRQAHEAAMGVTVADAGALVFERDPTPIDSPSSSSLVVEGDSSETADDSTVVAIVRALLEGRPRATEVAPESSSESAAGADPPGGPPPSLPSQAAPPILPGKEGYWKRVASLGVDVARALDYAHGQNVLHRDIKPSNLLLDDRGTVWVTDFGLAKAADQQDLTQPGDVLGTVRYLPPEAFEGVYGRAGDVYGLGLTLYELLARRTAYGDRDRARLIKRVAESAPPSLAKLDRRIPRDLATVVQKSIERDPARRYSTAGEFAADLQRFIDDEPVKARRASLIERGGRCARRNPEIAALASLLAALLVIVSIGSLAAARRFHDQAIDQHRLAGEEARARRRADLANSRLQSVRDVLRRTLYATRSNLAMAAWDADDFGQMRRHLDLLQPAPGEPDLRGWEYRYLKRLGDEERLTLLSPGEGFIDATFSPDGRAIASLELGDRIRLWDRVDGTLRSTIDVRSPSRDTLSAGVHVLKFSPDGRWLAGPGPDDALGLYDVATASLKRTIKVDRGAVLSLAWSPDGRRLVGGLSRHVVRVWNVADGQPIKPDLSGHYGPVASVDVSRDGRLVASGGLDGAVKLWSFDGEPRLVHQLSGVGEQVRVVAFSPDGRHVAAGSVDGAIRIWEAQSGRSVAVLQGHDGAVLCLAYEPDGRLASAGSDDTVNLWKPTSGRKLHTFKGHTECVFAVAFSRDGRDLLSASTDGSIKVWDADSPPRPLTLYSPSILNYGGSVACVAVSPDGRRIASGQDDHAVRIWDAATGRLLHVLLGHDEPIRSLAFSPDGRLLVSGAGLPNRFGPPHNVVRVWEVESGRLVSIPSVLDHVVNALAFLGDGHWLASGGDSCDVQIWNADDGAVRASLKGHAVDVRRLALSPDRALLASASNDGETKLWELPGGTLRTTLKGNGGHVGAIAFNHDGGLLATASGDATIQVWDVADGSLQQTLKGHLRAVEALAFAPDDRLASGGLDKSIRIWDLASGQSVLSLNGHSGSITDLAFGPDGRILASSSSDRTVKLWDAAPKEDEPPAEPVSPPLPAGGRTPPHETTPSPSARLGPSRDGA